MDKLGINSSSGSVHLLVRYKRQFKRWDFVHTDVIQA